MGECKWGHKKVSRQVVRDLIEQKASRLKRDLPDDGEGWQISYAVFSRAGLTEAALDALGAQSGLAIDLPTLDADLE
jgi:hypothetical protein